MSELITPRATRADFHWHLLATASALAFSAYVAATTVASADDADHPTVWIELGGQMERMDSTQQRFDVPFEHLDSAAFHPISPLDAQHTPRYAIGGEGRVSLETADRWVFSAAVRYGRSNGNRHTHQQSDGPQYKYVPTGSGIGKFHVPYSKAVYADTKAKHKESHVILDFMAGKDVGLGLFGSHSNSTFSAGARAVQFSNSSDVEIRTRPALELSNLLDGTGGVWYLIDFDNYHLAGRSDRSFRGLGPSLAWNGTVPVVRDDDEASLNVDFGLNAAVLFGRQKAKVIQQYTKHHFTDAGFFSGVYTTTNHPPIAADRSRTVAVPNLGGMLGLSLHFPNAAVSAGYRADFFFGAMDGGIDARKTYDRNFHGPFATISIGLGG